MSDIDSISLASTAPSEGQPGYEFEEILSETKVRGVTYYLVRWTNYRLDESTWEPIQHFDDPEAALKQWEETKAAIERGERSPVDIYALRRKAIDREVAAQQRRVRRRRKKKRLGIPVDSDTEVELSPSDFDHWEPSEPSEDEQEERELHSQPIWAAFRPIRFRRPLRKSLGGTPQTPRQNVIDLEDETREQQTQARRVAWDEARAAATGGRTQALPSARKGPSLMGRPRGNTLKSEADIAQHDSVVGAVDTTSSSRVFDPRKQTSGAQKALAGIKSRKYANRTAENGGLFKTLSMQNRVRKARAFGAPPDLSQLELFKPGEWLKPVTKLPERKRKSENVFSRRDDGGTIASRQNESASAWSERRQNNAFVPPLSAPTAPRGFERPNSASTSQAGNYNAPPAKKRKIRADVAAIYLHSAEKEIGCVTIGSLPPPVLAMVSVLNQKNNAADIMVQDRTSIDQYRLLCEEIGNKNQLLATGYVMASSDVVRALREFTRDLKEKREAALFYHPDNDVFIFYPAGAEEWAFLDRGQKPKFPGDFELHFAVSTALPRMSEVPALRGTSPTKPIELEEGELEPEREEGMPLDPIFQDKDEDVSMSMDMSLDTEPSPTKPLSLPLFGASFVSSLDEQGVRALFKTRFRIDLSDLTAVNGDTNPSKYFYLGFPSNTSHEFDFLRITLEKCNMEVYSNQTGRDWLSFKRATEDVSGTILLHESFSDFSAMPGFAKALRQRINVFYTSLSRPLSGRRDEEDDSNVFDTNNDVNFIDNPHFNLIFPHGGAILITDDLILRHPDRTLQIVSWFTNFVKTKFRGTWKLLFRPNVEQWLLELASLKNDERYVALYLLIRLNVPQYPRTHLNAYLRPSTPESLDGCSDDEGQVNPFVSTKYIPQYNARRDADVVPALRGSTMEQRNTDQLIEWFSGWALMNAERFRRFVAVTSFAGMKPLDRWKKWTHIEIMDSKEFMKEFLRSKAYGVSSSNAVAAEAKRAGQQKQQQQQQQPQQQLSRAA